MLSNFYTREGTQALIKGISSYRIFGENVTYYWGYVGEEEITWDKFGRYNVNQLYGDKLPHEFDLVSWE